MTKFSTAKKVRYTGMTAIPIRCWMSPKTIGMNVLPRYAEAICSPMTAALYRFPKFAGAICWIAG